MGLFTWMVTTYLDAQADPSFTVQSSTTNPYLIFQKLLGTTVGPSRQKC